MSHSLFSPLAWGLLLALLLLLLWRRLTHRWRVAGALLGLLLLALCAPLGANALVLALESLAPADAHCAQRDASPDTSPIVVLSGGFERAPRDLDDYAALNRATWKRLRAAVDLWRTQRAGALWIAGGGPYRVKESAMLARLASDWKVPVSALRIETQSTTTWDSAFALKRALPQRIRLVTSAMHLPRAGIAFRAAGFSACAQASDSEVVPFDGLGYWLPQASAIAKSEAALHELVGMVYYRYRLYRDVPADTAGAQTPHVGLARHQALVCDATSASSATVAQVPVSRRS